MQAPAIRRNALRITIFARCANESHIASYITVLNLIFSYLTIGFSAAPNA